MVQNPRYAKDPVTQEHRDSNICLLLYTILSQWNPIDASYYNNMKGFLKVLECQEAEILIILAFVITNHWYHQSQWTHLLLLKDAYVSATH